MCPRTRGQSEVVGVILLTAVIIVLVTVMGATILSQWQSEADSEPRVDVKSELNATTLMLAHNGGDSLPASEVRVIVEGDTTEQVGLEGFTQRPGERFHPGSTWRHDDFNQVFDGVVVVLVIHDPSETILHEYRHEVG